MQNSKQTEFGVSPAYFVSMHGEAFGPEEIAGSLPGIRDLGYIGFQAEIFDRAALEKWTPAHARRLARNAENENLCSGIFVAHFLGHAFATDASIVRPDYGLGDLERVFDLAREMKDVATVVVPALPLQGIHLPLSSVWPAFVEKVHLFTQTAAVAGLQLAIEPVPGGMVSSSAHFRRLIDELETASSGEAEIHYLLDTGNTWHVDEPSDHVVRQLAGRIAGTHLCDATGRGHRSAEPGTGRVKWARLLDALTDTGYGGALDVEIACAATDVQVVYKRARDYLSRATEMALQDGGRTT